MSRNQRFWALPCAVLGLLISLVVASSIGSVMIPPSDVAHSLLLCPFAEACDGVSPLMHKILWEIRLPEVCMAMLTGAGLAVTGAILQAVTRNPLADPYLFGISSGASLGAVIVLSTASVVSLSITLGALAGAMLSVGLMLVLAGREAAKVEHLLLSGVAVSFMLSAFTSLILYYSEPDTAATLLFWMMGSFSNSQWTMLISPALVIVLGVACFLVYRRWFTALLAGEESAQTLGIPVSRFRLAMLILCALITAVLVANVGGIGFVGLMVPHMARFFVGVQMGRLVPFCAILGGVFMVWVDVLARTLLETQVLPVGIVTSAIGSLFFFFILKYRANHE